MADYPGLLVVPPGVDPQRSLGFQVADWCEHLLCHGPGDVEGEPLELDDELVRFLVLAYALGADGRRKVNRAVLSRAKGRAKSEIAGMVACVEALGPVRFDHWAVEGESSWWGYRYKVGEPVGRLVRSPLVRCLATEEMQASNTYANVRSMLMGGRIVEHVAALDVGMTRTILPGGGEIRPCTAGSASKDGGKESFAVADETHLYVLPELHRMHDTVSRNLVKRKAAEPWMLETTTAHMESEASVAEGAYQYAGMVASGEVVNRGLLFDHRQGTCERWDDDGDVLAALAVAYGAAATWLDLGRILAEIRDPRTREVDGRRYFLNEPAGADSESWLPPGAWRACFDPSLRLVDGADTWVGVDMALRHDSVAVVAVQHHSGRYVVRAHVWRPAGDLVDVAAVEAHLRALHRRFRVVEIGYDPSYFQRSAEALADDGLRMVEIPQSSARMVPACQTAYALICAGEVAHDGDPVFTDQVNAAVPRQVGEGWRLSKGKAKRKIDAAIALALALDRATARGEPKPLVFAY